MHAPELTIRASAQPRRRPAIPVIATAVTALALAFAGTVILAANALRDGDGYFSGPTETFTNGGYAIAMKTAEVSDASEWPFGDAGLDSVRVKAYGDRPLFIGIAHAAVLDRYLRVQVDYDHVHRHAPRRPPAEESFWLESTSGAGDLALRWKPVSGDWRAVVMNADGSRGVTATLQFGARTSMLWWLGGALLVAGLVAAGATALLTRRASP